jgi:hypothetical protein
MQDRPDPEMTTTPTRPRTALAWIAVTVWLLGSLTLLWHLEYDDALRSTLCLSRPTPSPNFDTTSRP